MFLPFFYHTIFFFRVIYVNPKRLFEVYIYIYIIYYLCTFISNLTIDVYIYTKKNEKEHVKHARSTSSHRPSFSCLLSFINFIITSGLTKTMLQSINGVVISISHSNNLNPHYALTPHINYCKRHK